VSGSKVHSYNVLDAVGDCVTADGTKTRVHTCVPMVSDDVIITSSLQKDKQYGSGLPCGAFTAEKEGYPKVMRIK